MTSYLHIENFSLVMDQCKADVNTLLEYFTWIFKSTKEHRILNLGYDISHFHIFGPQRYLII